MYRVAWSVFLRIAVRKGSRNKGLESLRKRDAAKRRKKEKLIFRLEKKGTGKGGTGEVERDLPSSHGVVIENCRERRSPCTTIFGRRVFLSLALGVPKDAISRRKKRAVSCRLPSVAFHDAVSRCSTSRTIEKENTRSACACVRSPMYTETRSFSTNWATRRIGNIYFDPDKASRLRQYFK